jgi:heme A synthase
MKNPWLHRCAILLAVFTLIVITLGASLTSEIRPLPGSSTTSADTAPPSAPSLEQAHRIGGYAVVLLTLGLAIWLSSLPGPRLPGWIALGTVIVESLLGGVPIVHALFSPIFFAILVAIAVLTSESWQSGPKVVESQWEHLRPVGIAVPILVVIQIGLGVAFRHNAMGVISHILNAMVVLLVILVAGVFVLRQYPEHPSLRPAALALLIITGVQVLLGFSVYLVLLMSSENNPGLIITGVFHVANGALTLAASVVLMMQMLRNLKVTDRSVT